MTINALADLSHLGLLKIAGNDAKKFLQGQLTCNLEEISPTQTRLAAHCNPQGRMISLFRLLFYRESYYLQMPQESIQIALNGLKKYAVFFKTAMDNASDTLIRIGYCGNQLRDFIATLPEHADEAVYTHDLLIIKLPGNTPRYEILGEFSPVSALWEKLATTASCISNDAWKYFDIAAHIAALYPETVEKFLPHEINLDVLNGISFNKGCYTGQEIIARMQYRGKLKNRLYRARVTSNMAPERGSNIYRDTEIAGSIVDYCQIGYNNYEMLVIAQEVDIKTNSLVLNQAPIEYLDG